MIIKIIFKTISEDKMVVKVLGTGSYLPANFMINKDLEKIVETSDEWIRTRTGIKKRDIISEKS